MQSAITSGITLVRMSIILCLCGGSVQSLALEKVGRAGLVIARFPRPADEADP